MAVTITFLSATQYHAFYLVQHDGAAGDTATITNSGGATPDMLTDIDADSSIGQMVGTAVTNDVGAEALLRYAVPGTMSFVGPGTAFTAGQWGARVFHNAGKAEISCRGEAGVQSDIILCLQRNHSSAT